MIFIVDLISIFPIRSLSKLGGELGFVAGYYTRLIHNTGTVQNHIQNVIRLAAKHTGSQDIESLNQIYERFKNQENLFKESTASLEKQTRPFPEKLEVIQKAIEKAVTTFGLASQLQDIHKKVVVRNLKMKTDIELPDGVMGDFRSNLSTLRSVDSDNPTREKDFTFMKEKADDADFKIRFAVANSNLDLVWIYRAELQRLQKIFK